MEIGAFLGVVLEVLLAFLYLELTEVQSAAELLFADGKSTLRAHAGMCDSDVFFFIEKRVFLHVVLFVAILVILLFHLEQGSTVWMWGFKYACSVCFN